MSCPTIGSLRHRITIQTYSESVDSYGDAIKAYSNGDTVWAKVTPLSGKERVEALQVEAETSHSVLIRYRSDIKPNMRFSFDSRILEITQAINLLERGEWLQCVCTEILTTG